MLAVMATSNTTSPSTSTSGRPTGASSARIRIPSWSSDSPISLAEHTMASLITPRTGRPFRTIFCQPSAWPSNSSAPSRAKTTFSGRSSVPASRNGRRFGAPVTTRCGAPPPWSTSASTNRSALGCGWTATTAPTSSRSRSHQSPIRSMPSTSRPACVHRSASVSTLTPSRSTYVFNQLSTMRMSALLTATVPGTAGRWPRNGGCRRCRSAGAPPARRRPRTRSR